jgi:hypothetical protein
VEQVKIVVPEQVNAPIEKSVPYFKLAADGVEPAGKRNVSCAETFGFCPIIAVPKSRAEISVLASYRSRQC